MPLVLIVDDEPDIREVIKINLEAAGFRVVTAGTGEAALEAVRVEAPDAMFLDVMMPGIDGFTVLEQLKAESDEDLSAIPVFMVTGMDDPEYRIRGGIEGALRYITKPFDPGRLVQVIKDVLDPDAPTERELRRRVQAASLEQLARLERGEAVDLDTDLDTDARDAGRVRLTRLESLPEARPPTPRLMQARERMGTLTVKQRELLEALADGEPVTAVAERLEMSRSNIYSGLRRIARRLGLTGSDELLAVLRQGLLLESPPGGS